jgi:hypothetical protein
MMQQEQNALIWFQHMVKKGAINPVNPDMSLVPDNIIAELHWENSPDGESLPTQTAVNVTLFLFIAGKIAQQIRHGIFHGFIATENELLIAVQRLLLLAGLENFKRAGLLGYCIEGAWHDGDAKILISYYRPIPMGLEISPMLKTYFNFN